MQNFLKLGFRVEDDGHVYTGVFRKVDRGPVDLLRVKVSDPVKSTLSKRRGQCKIIRTSVSVHVFFPDQTVKGKIYTTTFIYERRLGGDMRSTRGCDFVGEVMKEVRELAKRRQEVAEKELKVAVDEAAEAVEEAKAEAARIDRERLARVKGILSVSCPICQRTRGRSCTVVEGTKGMQMILLDKDRSIAVHELRVQKAACLKPEIKEDIKAQFNDIPAPLAGALA
jgi:hypothetical protein